MSALNPSTPPAMNPGERMATQLAALERRVQKLERQNMQTELMVDGVRVRVELGRTESGRYGIRVYDNTGALVYDYTTAA